MRVVAVADAAAARPVHADRVHFVDISHGVVALGQIADRVHRRDVAVHGIEALEHDQLRPRRIGGLEQLFEMLDIVVPPDLLLAARLAHALDHRIVVERVRQDEAVRQQLGDGRDAGLVGDVAGGEHQRGRLARAGRRARARARPADGWCRRCCGCRRRRCPCARRSRPWRRPLSGAAPCRDSRWNTRSRPRAGLAANARRRAGKRPAMRSRSAKTR